MLFRLPRPLGPRRKLEGTAVPRLSRRPPTGPGHAGWNMQVRDDERHGQVAAAVGEGPPSAVPAPSGAPRSSGLHAWLVVLRPRQWSKNALVFVGLVFSLNLD